MPLVAIVPEPVPEQHARFSAPHPVHLWLATDCVALPVPAWFQSTPQPSQRCFAISLVVCPISVRTPEPFEAVSLIAIQPSLHLAQAIVTFVVEANGTIALRSSSCARSLGEAVMPSSPVGLYCALADPLVINAATRAKARAELRTILMTSFAAFISLLGFRFCFCRARFSRFRV
jgi:hypothetical protein